MSRCARHDGGGLVMSAILAMSKKHRCVEQIPLCTDSLITKVMSKSSKPRHVEQTSSCRANLVMSSKPRHVEQTSSCRAQRVERSETSRPTSTARNHEENPNFIQELHPHADNSPMNTTTYKPLLLFTLLASCSSTQFSTEKEGGARTKRCHGDLPRLVRARSRCSSIVNSDKENRRAMGCSIINQLGEPIEKHWPIESAEVVVVKKDSVVERPEIIFDSKARGFWDFVFYYNCRSSRYRTHRCDGAVRERCCDCQGKCSD